MSFIERLVVNEASRDTVLYDEHLVRYELAKQFVVDKVVLDLACGSGYGTEALLQAGAKKVIGIDIDAEVITEAQKNYPDPRLSFLVGEADNVPLENNSVDIITSFETIEHINNYEKYVEELARVLTGKGVALISTPNRDVFSQKNPFHIKEFTRFEFLAVLKKYFSTVKILEQKNGLGSIIIGTEMSGTIISHEKNSEALYFIAICSQEFLPDRVTSVVSLNEPALKKWQNNPGWRLVNKIYRLGQKLKFFK